MRMLGGFAALAPERPIRWPFTKPGTSEGFERAARIWDKGLRAPLSGIARPYALRLLLWLDSRGAARDGVSDLLQAYAAAVDAHLRLWHEDWIERTLRERSTCVKCGQQWRIENLSLCTHCPATFAPCCQRHYRIPQARNGNPQCPVCRTGELVG